jgi:hypothetical protein
VSFAVVSPPPQAARARLIIIPAKSFFMGSLRASR